MRLLFCFFIFCYNIAAKAEGPALLNCGSTNECTEAGLGLAKVTLALGALFGPHYLLSGLELEKKASYASMGLNSKTTKMTFLIASPFIKDSPHLIVTKLDLQEFTLARKNSLAKFLFGIGYGYSFAILL